MTDLASSGNECDMIIQTIKERFPEVIFDELFINIPYVAVGDFVRYIGLQAEMNKSSVVDSCFEFIEELHLSNSPTVREFATIGILEGIQNIFGEEKIGQLGLEGNLRPESKQCWVKLGEFWTGTIKHVG